MNNLLRICVLLIIVIAFSCNDNGSNNPMFTDNFDRGNMLEFWADEIIIPAYNSYSNSLQDFSQKTDTFFSDPTPSKLQALRDAWLAAYLDWQSVSMFEIGKAEETSIRNFTNIYPTDIDLINNNLLSGNFNLVLPSNFTAQGFPALDYLLFGSQNSDEEIFDYLLQDDVSSYFISLVDRLNSLTTAVLDDWNGDYRNTFTSNIGSSATASTDKLVNDFLFYYERFLRAGKVGIPAGVFSGSEEPGLVEGKYSSVYSKQLFEKGFSSIVSFFNGISFDGQAQGSSLNQYLDWVFQESNGAFDIAQDINEKWANVELALSNVGDNFGQQVMDDNSKMLALYDELQRAVPTLKADMLQALNIQIDFVDADGD